jgi:hypothetical protein
LDIPETISLNLLIFGSVYLNDEENNAVFNLVLRVLIRFLNEFSDSKLRVGSYRSFHAFTVEGRKYSE